MVEKISVWGDSVLKGIVLDEETGRYIRLGDRGCVPSVSRAIGIPIDNRSKFGMTSDKGRELVKRDLEAGKVSDIGIICFGGNDVDRPWREIAEHPDDSYTPNVPLEQFCDNLAVMATDLKTNGTTPIFVSIPPISADRYFRWFSKGIEKSGNILQWLGDVSNIYRQQELYNNAVLKTAKDLGCGLIDVRQSFLKMFNYLDAICLDGIHPNEYGHRIMERVFVEYAEEYIK